MVHIYIILKKFWNFKKNEITEEIETFDELADKIKSDFSIESKKHDKFRKIMVSLKQDTLNATMKKVNNFLFNETL